ncbi:MAG TPA: HlyD family efflux transporter periplasmic adaptor subunit [Stellaceae bacterium]|nr:HlyD family efflux transporter periplasmic adaptor subunit [Stellaceae bacterium]
MIGTAPIYSLAEGAHAEAAAWASFSAARDTPEFCRSWLAIVCLQIGRVGGGLLLLGPDADGAYAPAAVWPHAARDLQYLSRAAERALNERRGIVLGPDGSAAPTPDQRAHIGYPIEVAGVLHGAVVLDMAPGPEAALQRALRLLHWSSAWLVDQFRKRALEERDARLERVALAMDLFAAAIQERRAVPSALAVANELAARLACDRVSIGFEKADSIEVKAISHTATFDPKMKLARLIGEAMDEVFDLDTAITYPAPEAQQEEVGAIAHAELAREFHDVAVCSVPLLEDGRASGVLTLERGTGEPFDGETVALLKTVGAMLGPVLGLKRDNERGIAARGVMTLRGGAQTLVGPGHPGAKLIALAVVTLLVLCSLVSGTYRIDAKTVVEGAVQRVIAAPFDGYILQSSVRAGDTVKRGAVLARLDDSDLKLEQERLKFEREQLLGKERQALAAKDRAAMMVTDAQIAQANAALALVNERLARARLVAPFNGVVVSGDLSQLLGTPVQQGKVLFQVAPLDAYRVILEVDERDIADVAVGQHGELTLSGMPNRHMRFVVRQVTPVSTTEDGRNFFRVEAHLDSPSARIRPGMEGVGKIIVGSRNLVWIWTHSLVDWLRLFVWKWAP